MSAVTAGQGPLAGVRVIELGGIGPAPFGATMLADLGAEVIRVARPGEVGRRSEASVMKEVLLRGRRSIAMDLKQAAGRELLFRLVERADALIEPFRAGVVERMGIDANACLARNPRLIYAHMSGWGRDGSLSETAGHDINFIALAGALDPIGRQGAKPTPPLNLVGDFGGGGMLLALGVVSALFETRSSGIGQELDVAMVDGAAALMGVFHGRRDDAMYSSERGTNLLDSGAWFYDVYETADHKFVSVGAIEPEFCAVLVERLGFDPTSVPPQRQRETWSGMKERVAAVFATRTQAEWCDHFAGTDACFAPVLSVREAPLHAHNRERGSFVEVGGVTQPAPVPRFSRTPAEVQCPPSSPGQQTGAILREWLGVGDDELGSLLADGVVAAPSTT